MEHFPRAALIEERLEREVTYMEESNQRVLFPYNILLIGFMGTGKSTISAYMGDTYAMEVVEMDELIVEREGRSIAEIFAAEGETYFRDLETKLLIELQGKKNVIVSCGGGVPMRECNVIEMKKNGRVILLQATPETIYERVKDCHDRPLLENNMNVDYIRSLMEKRREKYLAAADMILDVDGKTTEEIAKELIAKLLQK